MLYNTAALTDVSWMWNLFSHTPSYCSTIVFCECGCLFVQFVVQLIMLKPGNEEWIADLLLQANFHLNQCKSVH